MIELPGDLDTDALVSTVVDLAYENQQLKAESRQLRGEIKQLLERCESLDIHERRCHDCGNVAWHKERVSPYVNCFSCGSADTREVRRRDNDE